MVRISAIFLAFLVALSLTAGAIAHAAEPIGCLDAKVAASLGHEAGDRDQVPSDDGKASPHHHGGCGGHQIGEPVSEGFSPQPRPRTKLPLIPHANGRVSAPTDPAFRPPRA